MNPKYRTEIFGPEFDAKWDEFVLDSPQGTIFNTSTWVRALEENYHYLLCFKGEQLVAGIVALEDGSGRNMLRNPYPFTSYHGILYDDNEKLHSVQRYSTELEAARTLAEILTDRYDFVSLANHWRIHDIRGFTWHTYFDAPERQFNVEVNYTSIIDLEDLDALRKDVKRETLHDVNKAKAAGVEIVRNGDLEDALRLRELTFARQGVSISDRETDLLVRLYESMKSADKLRSYSAYDSGGRLITTVDILIHKGGAYYMWAYSDPEMRSTQGGSLILWQIIEDLHELGFSEFDMCGINSPDRGRFKTHFGGHVRHFFILNRESYS